MRIIIITQDDPFFLKKNIPYLISILSKRVKVVGCVISKASPVGKKMTFFQKIIKTYNVFGFSFLLFYSLKFIYIKLFYGNLNNFFVSKNIPILKLKNSLNSDKSLHEIKLLKPDLIISVLGSEIFKKKLLKIPKKGCINLHSSLLPKYRGLMPTFWVLKNNEKKTGVSVFFIDEGIDSGPILVQKEILIGNKSHLELVTISKKIGMELIAKSVNLILNENINLIPNPDSKKTYFSFPEKSDVIQFRKLKKRFF